MSVFIRKFEIIKNNEVIGEIKKELSFFKPVFSIFYKGWSVEGDFMEWNYRIMAFNEEIAQINKEVWNFSDTYVIDIKKSEDAFDVLMLVLAIDAEKCSRN